MEGEDFLKDRHCKMREMAETLSGDACITLSNCQRVEKREEAI